MADAAELSRSFRRHVTDAVIAPLRQRLDAYSATLEEAMADIAGLAESAPETGDDEAAVGDADRRFRYADRFQGRFGERLFAPAAEARDAFFSTFGAVVRPPAEPTSAVVLPNTPDAPAPPDAVRPGPWRRLATTIRRREDREVPVSRLTALYMVALDRRLEPVAHAAARLTSIAVAGAQWKLHTHTDLQVDDAVRPPNLAAAAADVAKQLEAAAAAVIEEYDRALRATVIQVPDVADSAHEKIAARRADALKGWTDFETALMANVTSEAVLARALAAMEMSAADAAREIEAVRDHRGVEPLQRLTDGMVDLGQRAKLELEGDTVPVLESLAADAERLFAAEIPRLRALLPRIEEHADRLEKELAEIPAAVPEELEISEHAVTAVPERPRKLQVRDAPLEELLNTACVGALPRWLERSVATVREELNALVEELIRARNAVDFQLRAPLRGGFRDAETRTLVAGITERTAAQLEDLRVQGLSAVDDLATGLLERARAEAATLRSAVANREFMRIHSEIAEEQAVRQLASGVERARGAAGVLGRSAGRVWGAVAGGVSWVREWTLRQLGVAEVEREEMLESLEQSLLGQDQQVVALPGIYRQLFDVEADVPWEELLVPREEALEVVRRAFDRWVEDRSATVAVVGEKGSGKTTLLRLAEQQVFHESRVVHARLGPSTGDPAELVDSLAAAFGIDPDGGEGPAALTEAILAREPAVAILEDLHHLFIRAVGGFDAMETFLELVSATRDNVLWVVTVDEFAWKYLSRVMGLEAHFVHKVRTTNLSPEKLERAIMARHDVSGFSLRFETGDPDTDDSRWARLIGRRPKGGELTRKEAQRRRFFRDLAAIAEGNIVLGLFYWLRSIREIDEHVLVLGDPRMIDLEFLEQLPLDTLHSIAAIILHGGLSESAHRRVFQIPAVESRLRLASLADSHMVFLSSDGEYKINKVLYRPFIRLLVSRNIF